MKRTAIGVLVSGTGTNLRALLDASLQPGFPGQVTLVVSNKASVSALDIARNKGVAVQVFPASEFGGDAAQRDSAMLKALQQANIELVVLAGYDRILSDAFIDAFPDAILNLHPSLLPAFAGGMHAIADALAAGVKLTGCTVHFLEKGAVDTGAIVLQAAVPVYDNDDLDSLRQRVHEQEWKLLPEAVALWCEGRLKRRQHRVCISPASVTRSMINAKQGG